MLRQDEDALRKSALVLDEITRRITQTSADSDQGPEEDASHLPHIDRILERCSKASRELERLQQSTRNDKEVYRARLAALERKYQAAI